jgi:hypothetical protein
MTYATFNPRANHRGCSRDFLELNEELQITSGFQYLTADRTRAHKDFNLDLEGQHIELQKLEYYLRRKNRIDGINVKNQNYALANITCIVSRGNLLDDTHRRVGVSFPIKLPTYGDISHFFTFANLVENLHYELDIPRGVIVPRNTAQHMLQDLFIRGQKIVGQDTCGVQHPNFFNCRHDQFTKHSENIMLAAMSTRIGLDYILNRLSSELRTTGLYNIGDTVKIYALILHIHSTKTPCGVCEASLTGMQNSHFRAPDEENPMFLEKLQNRLLERAPGSATIPPHQQLPLRFVYPGQLKPRLAEQIGIRLFVTMTASKHDKDHQYHIGGGTPHVEVRANPRNRIYIANLDLQETELGAAWFANYEPDLNHRTVFLSAGERSKDSSNSKKTGRGARAHDDEKLADMMAGNWQI